MNIQFHECSIKNKSSEEKERWQNHFSDSNFYITRGFNGILCVISPTGSGKTKAIKRLLDYTEKAIVIKNDNPTVCEQWKNEGINSISLHLHDMDLDTFKERINYDKVDTIIFDEAHEIYSFNFYGHGCHNCHQTEDHIGIFKKRYEKNPNQNILSLAKDKKIILLSATMDSLCCEDLPPYCNLIPIDIYVNKPEPEYYGDLPTITKISNDNESICRQIHNIYQHSINNEKISVWVANKKESTKIKIGLISQGLNKSLITEFNSEQKNLDIIKLNRVSIFIQGGISGINDKELKSIFILRPGLNSNDTNNEKDKQNISVAIIQIIGRIREKGGNVYITRHDEIDLERYIQESYSRILSDKTKNNYTFFYYINKYKKDKGYLNEECIKTQRIPGLINNIIKNDKCRTVITSETLIGQIKTYIERNQFFKKMKEFLDNPGSIHELFIKKYLDHIDKISEIFESHFNVVVSKTNIKYSDKWITERSLTTSIKTKNNQELKKELYELCNCCELRGIKTSLKNLDLAHIKEAKDNGQYSLENCILIQPSIHNYWDNGSLIIFLNEDNEIEIENNDPYLEEDPDYELVKKNTASIRKTFKRIDLSNLQFRLENKLSHE